jgi:hypothetical protein
MRIGNAIKWAVALGLIGLSGINASGIAPQPIGSVTLIASKTEDKGGCATLKGTRRTVVDTGGPIVFPADSAKGCMPLSEALIQLPTSDFMIRTSDAEKMVAMFNAIKRPLDARYSFIADNAVAAAIRAKSPKAWVWNEAGGKACFAAYVKTGWFGITPDACKNATILIPIDQKWKLAGWPKRFVARMEAAGARMILTGPEGPNGEMVGINALEQIPDVPRDYNGYMWVDDILLIGPAIER